jgi:hypothetical protein
MEKDKNLELMKKCVKDAEEMLGSDKVATAILAIGLFFQRKNDEELNV